MRGMDRTTRETQILQAAKAEFATRGYHGTAVSDVIRRAQIARGTFYLYFKSKHALFERLLDDAFEEIHSRIKTIRVGADDPPPLIQLRANLSGAITYLLRDRPMTSILLHHAVGLDPIIDKKVVAFESRLLALIETALAYGQEIGLVRPCEPHVVGLCALGMIKEVVRSVSASREWEAQLDPLVDEILTMGLKGLLFQTPRRERKRAQEPKKVGLRLVKT